MRENKVVIIGGGPGGIMAAISAAQHKNKVTLIEKNSELGKKLKITGGGRCNLTNNKDPSEILNKIVTNKKFLTKSIYAFTSQDLMSLIEENGCPLKVEADGCVFPKSDDSKDIIEVFYNLLKERNVQLMLETTAKKILMQDKKVQEVLLDDGLDDSKELAADSVILATGGISYPGTGSTGTGHEMAKELGHTITPLRGSLLPMEIKEKWLTELAGISFNEIALKFKDKNKSKSKSIVIHGDLLLTHFGISGPAALELSSYLKDKELSSEGLEVSIDFLPSYSHEELQDEFISLRDKERDKNKQISNILTKYWPKNFTNKLLKELEIDSTTPINHLSKKDRNKLIEAFKDFKITVIQLKSTKEATVTSGGVSVKEVDPSTMESKLIKGLYFAGEILDVDALSGGYNLQIAFSTGHLAGHPW